MSTKFFTNSTGNTLFDKFKGIAADMINFDSFLAVVGFFRSSGMIFLAATTKSAHILNYEKRWVMYQKLKYW